MIKAVTRPTTRGPRFIANRTTGEIHDMTRVCASCRVSKIKSRVEADSIQELRDKLKEPKPHKDCIPNL